MIFCIFNKSSPNESCNLQKITYPFIHPVFQRAENRPSIDTKKYPLRMTSKRRGAVCFDWLSIRYYSSLRNAAFA